MSKVQIALHDNQYEIATDPHRFKVVCAGRRFGKSVLSRALILKWATERQGLYWIVSPTYQMGKDIHWKQGFNQEIPKEWILKKNEADFEITLINGSRIALRSAEHPDRLRGMKLSGLVVDETAFIQKWADVWLNALRPSLTDLKSPALFISSPLGFNHFYDLYMLGQKEDTEWKSWRFTSYDNPKLPREEIEKIKQELDEDAFAQEMMAEFKKFTGLVWKDFRRETHVIEPIELKENYTYYRSIDFGFVNPTGVLFACVTDKGELIIYDEIYQKGLQTPDLATLILQKSVGHQFTGTFADSAQASDIAELQKYTIGVTPVSKTSGAQEDWTTYRIRKVAEKFKNNSIKITKNCVNLIWEIENYRYHEVNKNGIIKETPMKVNDHCHDKETRVFTLSGLKSWEEVSKEDYLLTVNLKKMVFEWQKPIKIIKKRYKGKMLLVEKKHLNFCTTPDHNFLFNRQYYVNKKEKKFFLTPLFNQKINQFWFFPPSFFRYSSGFNNNHEKYITIPRQKRSKEKKVPSSTGFYKLLREDFCEFLGLWLAEGTLSKSHYQIIIDQSIKNKRFQEVERVVNLMKKYHFKIYSWVNKNQVKRWSILSKSLYYFLKQFKGSKKGNKIIPKFIWKWQPRCLQKLFYGMYLGDGTFSKSLHYDTVSEPMAKDFLKLSILNSWGASLRKYTKNRPQPLYRIHLHKNKEYVYLNFKKDVKIIDYDDYVYCATVPNMTLVTERKGCVLISGNCVDALSYLIVSLPQTIKVENSPTLKLEVLPQFQKKNWSLL